MSASPEFFKPAAPAFSPLPRVFAAAGDDYDYDCTTPTGSRISYLKEPTTCPPAPRKPPPPPPQCRKRLFQSQAQAPPATESSSTVPVPVISLRLDELERIFRPHPPPATADKRRRSVSVSSDKHCAA